MSMTDTVLVLSKDASRARDLKTILEFVGEEAVLDDGLSRELLAGGDPQDLASLGMAIVAAADDAEARTDIAMVCKADPGLPVLVVGNPDLESLEESCQARVIARLEWPPITPSSWIPCTGRRYTVTSTSAAGARATASSGASCCSAPW